MSAAEELSGADVHVNVSITLGKKQKEETDLHVKMK